MSGEVLPFILCGGAGTRLWPLSREAFPKQFHRLIGPHSLFQDTCRRLSGGIFGGLSVLSNHQHRFLIQEQLREAGLGPAEIVLEPASRNTAPAACVASLMAASRDPEALVLLAPSDHAIGDGASFAESVSLGAEAARRGSRRHLRRRARLPAHGLRIYRDEWKRPRNECSCIGEALR